MSNYKSLLSNYIPNNYESDIDPDAAIAKRRKALEEIRVLLRKKYLQQIDFSSD